MPSCSIYRGQTSAGIGEAPGVAVRYGEQYLHAAPELWQQGPAGLFDAARAWLTLDGRAEDYSLLGDDLEAWSAFPYDGDGQSWRFVARLTRAGIYDRRPAYFAHGRGWRTPECVPENDPGSLIANTGGFCRPWREQRTDFPELPIQAEIGEWRILLDLPAERAAAASYLAALYYARLERGQVAITVEPKEFRTGGGLAKLVAFARAALPWDVKRDCRIRIYTSLPSTFLRALKADLIAIPQDLARAAVDANPAVVLLDRQGNNYSGSSLPATATGTFCQGYAERVIDRFLDAPPAVFVPALLPFSGRVADVVGQKPNGDVTLAAVANLYDFVAVKFDQTQIEQLLRFVYREASQNSAGTQPWNRVILQEQWSRAPESVVYDLSASPAATPDARKLRSEAWQEAARRAFRITPPTDASTADIVDLVGRRLLDDTTAAERLLQASAKDAYAVLDEPERIGTVARLLLHTHLPDAWVNELPSLSNPVEVSARLIDVAAAEEQTTEQPAATWAPALAAALRMLEPKDLNAALVESLRKLRIPLDIRLDFLITETIYRVRPETAQPHILRLQGLTDREARRAVFRAISRQEYTFLQDFHLPGQWDRDINDLLAASETALRNINVRRLSSIAEGYGQLPAPLAAAFDGHMQASAQHLVGLLAKGQEVNAMQNAGALANAETLIARGQWLKWRCASRLDEATRRSCAQVWLLAAPGVSGSAGARFEEWEQAMVDLGNDISGAEIAAMRRIVPGFQWPCVRLFEDVQIKALVAKARDLGAVAEIAAAAGNSQLRDFEEVAEIPRGLLAWLHPDRTPSVELTLEDARVLLAKAGHRTGLVRPRVVKWMAVALLRRRPDSVAWACALNLLGEPEVATQIFGHLLDDVFTEAELATLESRADELPGEAGGRFAAAELRQMSGIYRNRGYSKIASALMRAAGGEPLFERAAEALLAGDADAECWAEIKKMVKVGQGEPIPAIIHCLAQKDAATLKRLDEYGWATLQQLCSNDPGLGYTRASRVPLLELAAFIRAEDSIGAVASGVLKCVAPSERNTNAWWPAFLKTMRNCPRRDGCPLSEDRFEHASVRVVNLACELFKDDSIWESRLTGMIQEALKIQPQYPETTKIRRGGAR